MSRRRRGKAKQYSGEFNCGKCNRRWISINVRYNIPHECAKCGTFVFPKDLTLISPIDTIGFKAVKDKKYFGGYECWKCMRFWWSAHAWLDCGQMCKRCDIMIKPHKLRELKRTENKNDNRKPHETSLCEKCKSLGFNCSKTRSK